MKPEDVGHHLTECHTPHISALLCERYVSLFSCNLRQAQELARNRIIAVTQSHMHLSDDELDKGYYEILESNLDGSSLLNCVRSSTVLCVGRQFAVLISICTARIMIRYLYVPLATS